MIQNHSNNNGGRPVRPVRQYDEAFKRDAVRLLEESGRPRAQVARDLGVSDVSLATWQSRRGSAGASSVAAGAGEGSGGIVAALAENARLRTELEHMTRQRDILKKAMAIVSQEPKGGLR